MGAESEQVNRLDRLAVNQNQQMFSLNMSPPKRSQIDLRGRKKSVCFNSYCPNSVLPPRRIPLSHYVIFLVQVTVRLVWK